MGWWQEQPRPRAAYRWRIEAWASFLGGPEGLAETTVANYCWWASGLLEWLQEQDVPLRQITLAQMDRFMEQLSSKGLSRVTLATAAKALRRFLPYAHEQGWCRRDLAQGVLSPGLYRQENLPAGPAWSDVKRLIAATGGSTVGHPAVYGLYRPVAGPSRQPQRVPNLLCQSFLPMPSPVLRWSPRLHTTMPSSRVLPSPHLYWLGNHRSHQSGTSGLCNEAAAFALCYGLEVLLALLRSGLLLPSLRGPGHPEIPRRL